jgi:hypothetical protein
MHFQPCRPRVVPRCRCTHPPPADAPGPCRGSRTPRRRRGRPYVDGQASTSHPVPSTLPSARSSRSAHRTRLVLTTALGTRTPCRRRARPYVSMDGQAVRPGRTSAGSCTRTHMKASLRSWSCERITSTAAPPTVPAPIAPPSPLRRRAHSRGWMHTLPYASEHPLTHPARSALVMGPRARDCCVRQRRGCQSASESRV